MDKTMQFQYSPNSESNNKASPKKNTIATPLGGFNKKIPKIT